MRTFVLLYNGPPTPPGASHEGWPEWFQRLGDRLVDKGAPLSDGFVVHADGTTSAAATSLNGYSIIRAESRDAVADLVRDHPFLVGGPEYRVEVFDATGD